MNPWTSPFLLRPIYDSTGYHPSIFFLQFSFLFSLSTEERHFSSYVPFPSFITTYVLLLDHT